MFRLQLCSGLIMLSLMGCNGLLVPSPLGGGADGSSTTGGSQPDESPIKEGDTSTLTDGGPAGTITTGDGGTSSGNDPTITPPTGGTPDNGQPGGNARDTFYVQGKDIYDPCGQKFVARGVNHPTLYVDRKGEAMPEIAKTGANMVRIFWFAGHGISITEAESAITACEQNGMVAMLEMHDSTCSWNLGGITSYWTSPEAVALIKRHERSLWLNIANEASSPNADAFKNTYAQIIKDLRAKEIRVPIVVDAPGCGRDNNTLLGAGKALTDADPLKNVVFSWHIYDSIDQAEIGRRMEAFNNADLPLVIGEFAHQMPTVCHIPVQYKGVIAEAQRLGVGWLAWSWGNNDPSKVWNGDCPEHDMTDTFAFSSLKGWGLEVAVSDANSIKNTAVAPKGLDGACK